MRIAVLSGKGGTGKTLVAVNLAAAAERAIYIDCDVEEPNGHLFFKPENISEEEVSIKIPLVDNELCNACRQCVDFCKFNALAYVKDKLIIFNDVCHSCGGCVLICPEKALSERKKVIGKLQRGSSGNVSISSGILNIGEESGGPIIGKLLEDQKATDELCFIDCPPGSGCIVMDSIKDADYCILVAEPTVFGTHNLNMVYDLVKLFKKPFSVVLNKCIEGEENPSEKFCTERDIKILARIPFDKKLGTINSNAEIAAREDEGYREKFSLLLDRLRKEVRHEAAADS